MSKIRPSTQLALDGATSGQAPVSDGTKWVPTSIETTAHASATYAPLPAAAVNALTGMFHVDGFGVKFDLKQVRDAVTTSGSPIVTSATAGFTQADVGKTVSGYPSGSPLSIAGTILSVQSSTQCTVSANATANATGVRFTYGTDNLASMQAAHDALPAKGGTIYLPAYGLAGMSGPVVITKPNVTVQGGNTGFRAPQFGAPGLGCTLMAFQDTDVIEVRANATDNTQRLTGMAFRNFGIFSAPPGLNGRGIYIHNIAVGGGATDWTVIEGMSIGNMGYGVWQSNGDSTQIIDSWISENGVNIHSEDSIYCTVARVVLADGGDNVQFLRDMGSRVVDCIISHGQYGVTASNSSEILVKDNTFVETNKQSVALTACSLSDVSGNVITRAAFDGVLFYGTTDSTVRDNIIRASGITTDNTYDHIKLDGSSGRNNVRGNVLRAGNEVNRTRYAVNVVAGGADNVVVDNDMLAAAWGADILDAGTRTITTAGNRFAQAARDSFTRTSASSLGTADTGQAWTALVGTWGTTGTQAYCPTPSGGASSVACVETNASDVDLQVTLVTSGDAGLAVRLTDQNNHFAVVASGGAVYRVQGGSASQVATFAACSNGDKIRIVAGGNVFTLYKNGAQVATWTDSFNQTATRHGLRLFNDSAVRFDDFAAVGI